MSSSSLSDVHEWLTNNGFERDKTETCKYLYKGILECNHIEVPIQLSFSDLTFQQLPEIHLLDPRHEILERPLPHVDHKNKLCYLEQETYHLDPYDPLQTVVNLLALAKNVLTESITGKNVKDVGYEFSSYWEPETCGLALSRHQSGDIIKYNYIEYDTPIGNKKNHPIIGDDNEIAEFKERHCAKSRYEDNCTAIWIDINETTLLPRKGPWPPKHFKQFYDWLDSVDDRAAKTLKKVLGTKRASQQKIMILLNTRGGIVGAEVIAPKNLTQSPSRFVKQLLIDKGKSAINMHRTFFYDYSNHYLTTRNLTCADLSGKKIVLIGCGNIGGYLSRLLVQAGAGRSKGQLTLYDAQSLSTGNIGRHYLDENYLYENKALACKHKLEKEFRSINIKAVPKEFVDLSDIGKVDVIIDSTGREPFSLTLNNQVIERRRSNKQCPDIIYLWNDGNGYCGRALYYNGTGGCYRCLRDKMGRDRFPPLKSEHDLAPVKYQCGESYIPYSPSVSVQTAALGLDMILDWNSGNVRHHFRNKQYHEKAREHKDNNLCTVKGCPACQK